MRLAFKKTRQTPVSVIAPTPTQKLTFNGQLYDFQQNVLTWTETRNKGIIGLDMGLGKTVITIAMICQKNFQRSVVVLPLQILDQWRASLIKFSNLTATDICLYQGGGRKSCDLSKYRVVLTTYDVIRTDINDFNSPLFKVKDHFDNMILDEAHKIRNKKTQSYLCCHSLGGKIHSKWLLTGTTIHNKFTDFYTLCEFLDIPGLSKTIFADPITAAKWRQQYYIRLTKMECDLNLPEKSVHDHFLQFDADGTHRREYYSLYEETKDFYIDYVMNPTQLNFTSLLTKILRLRQCCNHPDAILDEKLYQVSINRHDDLCSAKFTKIIELIKNTPSGDKSLIFSQWSHSLKLLGKYLTQHGIKFLEYNGTQSIQERNYILQKFRDDTESCVLLITLTSGGVGLDMSFANHVIIMDSWWNLAMEEQAIDRVYRIGQKKKVEVHRLYMNGTIEHWLVQMKLEKQKVAEQFHQKGLIYSIDQSILTDLLHKYI
jgi:SNF2 family DNA or RNA helicase